MKIKCYPKRFCATNKLLIIAFPFLLLACKKDDQKKCGCDSPDAQVVEHTTGTLTLDSTAQNYTILVARGSGMLNVYHVCNAGMISDSIKSNMLNKPITFSGRWSEMCANEKPNAPTIYFHLNLTLTDLEPNKE